MILLLNKKERERVLTWREDELLAAGYPLLLAVDLARRGCPPKLALRILV